MVERNIGVEEVEECRQGDSGGDEEERTFFFDEKENPEETDDKKDKQAVEEKNRAEGEGAAGVGEVAHDTAASQLMQVFQERFADHFVIGKVDEKITQKKAVRICSILTQGQMKNSFPM